MNRWYLLLALLIMWLCVCLSGCSSLPVQVERAVPEELVYNTETLDLRNCDSNVDMVTTLGTRAPIKQQISMAAQATMVETASTIDTPLRSLMS